jgi:drug/metabolite transporter (DMT)-like permease
MRRTTRGVLLLLGTSLLWGSSFPAIKYSVSGISEYTYTWLRSAVAMIGLAPYMAYALSRGRVSRRTVERGVMVGVAYALALWLQGWGTKYTSASNSAFITGLDVVFVHAYASLMEKRYEPCLGLSLALSVAGLYLLTSPSGSLGMGDFLVLLGAFVWAAQIILVDRFSDEDPLAMTFFEMSPALIFAAPDLHALLSGGGVAMPRGMELLVMIYLGLACSVAAYALQIYGQRFVPPTLAGIVFLLEPVFASLLAAATLHEAMNALQAGGAALILASLALAARSGAHGMGG